MKRVLALTLALGTAAAFAQTSAPKKSSTKLPAKKSVARPAAPANAAAATPAVAAPAVATPANTSVANEDSATMKILKERLQIRYFAEFLGPNVEKWEDNQVDVDGYNSAAKGKYARSTDPINLFNQFSFRWKVGDVTRFNFEARFTAQIGDRNELGRTADRQVIVQEDHRVGFNINYYSSPDKVWNMSILPRVRIPTSQASQDANIILQPDILHIFSFQATSALNLSLWNSLRYYWFEQKVDSERYRFYTGPSVTYVFNDTFEFFGMYEHELQHRNAEGARRFNYVQESLQDVYAGINININPSLTVTPLIRFAQLQRWGWEDQRETMQIAAWISGAIF